MANSEQTKRALAEGLKTALLQSGVRPDHCGGHHRVQRSEPQHHFTTISG